MIRRETYMKQIRPFIGKDLVKVLTGIRRSGKSVFLQLIAQELAERGIDSSHFIMYNFEDMSNSHLCTAESLHTELDKRIRGIEGKTYLFLDEIQEVSSWEKCINSIRVKHDCDIYITGSNAKLLSGELATYLAGRYVEFIIYPYSYAEFRISYLACYPDMPDPDIFRQYLLLGGMPYLGNLSFEEKPSRQYLQDVFSSVVLKDIMMRNTVRDADLLRRIIAYVFGSIGTTFSANSLSNYFKSENRTVAKETILNYLKYCEDAFLLYRVSRQDLMGKKILAVNEKYYVADHGLREAVYGGNMRDINLTLENIVFLELLRRGYQVTVGKKDDREIDFVCETHKGKIYIQVTYLLASQDTIDREFGAFRGIEDNYPKYVLSMDDFDMSRDGIIHRNIPDFLLEAEFA